MNDPDKRLSGRKGSHMHELVCTVTPPDLRGLNRLAQKLNAMRRAGAISDWHLGRWADGAKTGFVVLFDDPADAAVVANQPPAIGLG